MTEYEPSIMKYFEHEGDTFIDIGAHLGEWIYPMSKYYKKIIAFEPNPIMMKANFTINKVEVKVHKAALSGFNGEANLYIYEQSGHNSLRYPHPLYPSRLIDTIKVKCRTLDFYEFQLTKNDLVKIDTEDEEVNIVIGGMKTLEKCRLCIEIHSELNMNTIQNIFPDTILKKSDVGQWYVLRL